MPLPSSDDGWRDLVRAGMPPCWSLLAEGSGGSVIRTGGVTAAVVPGAPHRSVFNSVFYEDAGELLGSLEELAAAYEDAGVSAWTVWVPEDDEEAARGLKAAGHVLDAEPRYMAMALSELRDQRQPEGWRIAEREDLAEMARLNEVAYGYPEGDFGVVAEAPMPGIRIYFAELDGGPVATLGVWPHAADAVVIWVATLPEARNRGIATGLLAHALERAREDGLETTTLQSTKLGRPVYERLGYRDLGAAHMYEKRLPGGG